MRRKLSLMIESGDETCAYEPGKFCPWLRTTHLGSRWICGLFDGKEIKADPDPIGWLQRLSECIDGENYE